MFWLLQKNFDSVSLFHIFNSESMCVNSLEKEASRGVLLFHVKLY